MYGLCRVELHPQKCLVPDKVIEARLSVFMVAPQRMDSDAINTRKSNLSTITLTL